MFYDTFELVNVLSVTCQTWPQPQPLRMRWLTSATWRCSALKLIRFTNGQERFQSRSPLNESKPAISWQQSSTAMRHLRRSMPGQEPKEYIAWRRELWLHHHIRKRDQRRCECSPKVRLCRSSRLQDHDHLLNSLAHRPARLQQISHFPPQQGADPWHQAWHEMHK